MEPLRSQIANLQRKLSRMQVQTNNNSGTPQSNPRRRRPRRRRPRAGAGGYVAPRVSNPNPRAGAPSKGISPQGSMRIARRELLGAVDQKYAASIEMVADSFPWLKKLSASFERIAWRKLVVLWKPAVGTTTNGRIMIGADWDAHHANTTATSVAALTPIMDVPVWQQGTLVLPPNRLMTRKEYMISDAGKTVDLIDRCPVALAIYVGGTGTDVIGHVWIDYEVDLFGTA